MNAYKKSKQLSDLYEYAIDDSSGDLSNSQLSSALAMMSEDKENILLEANTVKNS